jgi:hypothetical protein
MYAVNAGRTGDMDWVVMVRLSMPASLSDLSWWICHSASARGILYAVEHVQTGWLTWPRRLGRWDNYFEPDAVAAQATLFGALETDIVVPFPHGVDPMLINPENWMKNTLERVNATVENL